MNFLLSEDQRQFQDAVRRFLGQAYPATYLHQLYDSGEVFVPALWSQFAALGTTAIVVPEAYGGLGLKLIDLALVLEAVGHAGAPLPLCSHAAATLAIVWAGSEAQRARWLPRMAEGSLLATVALQDAGGWQPDEWTLSTADTLHGTKAFVPGADVADLIVVGLKGGELAVVERGAPGLAVQQQPGIDRTRPLFELTLDGTPAERLPHPAEHAARLRDALLVLLAADAFGGASRCVEMALDYAKVRQQFGQPIGRFQGLKYQLVDMAVDIEPARGLYWYAAHAFDDIVQEAQRSAALAKSHLCDQFVKIARQATEAHGGIGYTWEFDLHILFKRAMFDYAWLGNPADHRQRAAALAAW